MKLAYYHGETVNSIVQAPGLLKTITAPKPGLSGGDPNNAANFVVSTFTYDALGSLLTEVTPGNNAATTLTTTMNYTSDPAYSYTQTAALRQAVTRTDNLGHVTHLRYDSQGNMTAVIDALGNRTDLSYNIANSLLGIQFAATTNTLGNTGRCSLLYTYQYPGGSKTAETQYNESSVNVWQVNMTYGKEGELLTRTGSTQPYTVTYDALYRLKTVADGSNHVTNYYYKQQSYLDAVTYPGYTGATPVYNAASDGWTNVCGKDSLRFPTYNLNGTATQRTDGRGWTTGYTFNDPESKLTAVTYPAAANTPNVSAGYESYGRMTNLASSVVTLGTGYDDGDRTTSTTTTYAGLAAKTLTYAYYPDGSSQTLGTPWGNYSSSYDAAARLTGLTNPTSQSWSWSYSDNNWLNSQTANGQIVTAPTRNNRGFVTTLLNRRTDMAQTTLSSYAIGYSPNLTVGTVTSSLPGYASLGGTTNYTHDTKLQLTQEQSTRSGGYTSVNAYDSAGNPTTFKGASGQTFNSSNQRTGTPFAYDNAGNPTTYKSTPCTYDAENRLTAYGAVLTAEYRPDGLRT